MRLSPAACLALALGLAIVPARAVGVFDIGQPAFQSQSDDEWCRDAQDSGNRDREHACEVRQLTMSGSKVDVTRVSNGSVAVTGTARRDIAIRARVVAQADTSSAARDLLHRVSVTAGDGRVRAEGPDLERHESWWVSYRIEMPRDGDLRAEASNGSIGVEGVNGVIRAETSNGSVRLTDVGGDVVASTSNGSMHVSLSGSTWSGRGLEASTSNGSLVLELPREFNAHLEASTGNGSLRIDRPITIQGRIGHSIETDLGKGGPTLRVRTGNGSLKVSEK